MKTKAIRKDQYSFVLLAGGKGRRIGKNKALLQWGGKSFLEHMLDKAETLGMEKILISGFDAGEKAKLIYDQFEDRGPLGGIHACLKQAETPYCLFVPVDVPNLPVHILEKMIVYHERNLSAQNPVPVLLWEHGDRKEPLIGIYPKTMADGIERLIEPGSAPVFRMLDRWPYECLRIEIDGITLINVNTQEAYEKLRATERK